MLLLTEKVAEERIVTESALGIIGVGGVPGREGVSRQLAYRRVSQLWGR